MTALADRRARGKAGRSRAPRSSHAGWSRAPAAADPVSVLEAQAPSRDPDLVPIRYGRMLASPFAFYRGGAAIMAADLAGTPDSGLTTQLCGDAHLSNFGGFASPERTLVFDINDFDETLPGPWEWDLKRLAASIEIAGRSAGFAPKSVRSQVLDTTREYRAAMREFAALGNLELWASRMDLETAAARWGRAFSPKGKARAERRAAKARSKDHTRALARLTHRDDGALRINNDPPLIVPVSEWPQLRGQLDKAEGRVKNLIAEYGRTLTGSAHALLDEYEFVDMARKVVGVGSVGTRAMIALFVGRDEGDPLFLQVKEAQPSVLEEHLRRSRYRSHGRRVVEGQWLMQAASDVFLGWLTAEGVDGVKRDFYVRQLWDWKMSAVVEQMSSADLAAYGGMCGWILARAHARTGDRVAIAAYVGRGDSLDRSIADFARTYADQNERDYEQFAAAADSGKIKAEIGI